MRGGRNSGIDRQCCRIMLPGVLLISAPLLDSQAGNSHPVRNLRPTAVIHIGTSTLSDIGISCGGRETTALGTRWAALLDCPTQHLRSVPAAVSNATMGTTRATMLDATGRSAGRLPFKRAAHDYCRRAALYLTETVHIFDDHNRQIGSNVLPLDAAYKAIGPRSSLRTCRRKNAYDLGSRSAQWFGLRLLI